MFNFSRILLTSLLSFVFSFNSSAESLPSFVLGCTYGGGQPWYRLVSDGKDVYFASILNQVNINATMKSISTVVEPRAIKIILQEGTGERSQALLHRDTLSLVMKTYSESSYSCEKISDNTTLNTLKSAYETTLQQNIKKQKAYNNRPNKL